MRSVSSPMALSMMIAGPSGPAMRRQMASPSSPGSMMSSTIRSIGPRARICSISEASPAVSTAKLCRRRNSETTSRMPGSSSTIKTRACGPPSVLRAAISDSTCMALYPVGRLQPHFNAETASYRRRPHRCAILAPSSRLGVRRGQPKDFSSRSRLERGGGDSNDPFGQAREERAFPAAPMTSLPIEERLPAIKTALAARNSAVIVAPPGAGKTTVTPLALLGEPWVDGGKLIVLEPRRLAARAAAARMAETLGEGVGQTVGYRVRLESRTSARTRIEVVTEGVFTRMILDDPGLDGVAGVLFDEFHERSLDADLGLALARDSQALLRPELRLLVMSATLDGARVASLLDDAPVIESHGRAWPVDTRYLGRAPVRGIEDQTVR